MKKILSLILCVSIIGASYISFVSENASAGTITVVAQNYITGSSTVEWNFNNEGWNIFTANPASSEPYSPPTTPAVYTTTSDGSFVGDGISFQPLVFRYSDPNTGTWVKYYDGHGGGGGGSGWYDYCQVSMKWGTGDYKIYVSVPYEPYNPQPSNGAGNQPIDADISWISEQENPSYPGAIEPEPNGADAMNLNYDIFFGTTNPPPYVSYQSYLEGVNTYDPGILINGQTYYWQIISYAGDGGGSTGKASPVWSFTTTDPPDTTPPAAITDLATSNPTTSSITLTWTAPGDDGNTGTASGYIVKYSTSGQITEGNWGSATTFSQSWTPQSAGATETHIINGLAPETTYWFAIKAYDEVPNYGAISNSPSGTTATGGDTTPPSAIADLATSNPTTNSITLTWIAPGDDGNSGTATGYVVKYSSTVAINDGNWASATTFSQSWTPQSAGNTETHVVSGLSSGTQYWFAIKAYDEVPNYGAISNSPSGTTAAGGDTTPPSAITNVATSNPTTNSITLTWTAPGDDGATGTATGYVVKYSTTGQIIEGNWGSATTFSQSWTPQIAGNAESHQVNSLNSGTQYWFAIKAYDEVPNYGAISNSPSGTTDPLSPPPPEITQVTSLYKNFYIEGLEMSNTFYVTVNSQDSVDRVEFKLTGEATVSDSAGANGWSAELDMSNVQYGETLTVTAYTASSSDSETIYLDVVRTPTWFDTWRDYSNVFFQQTTHYQVNNEWVFKLEFKVPRTPVDVEINVPSYIPVFGGEYSVYFLFIVGGEISSDSTITIYGGGNFNTTVMSKKAAFGVILSGTWEVQNANVVWNSVSIIISGEIHIPLFKKNIKFELYEGMTILNVDLEISIVPQASLTVTLEPSTSGFQIVSGIAITSISGQVGLGIEGSADLTIGGAHIGSVSGGGNANIGFKPGGGWIDWFSVDAYFQVTLLGKTFELGYTWDWTEAGTKSDTRGMDSSVEWNVISISGECNAEVTDYSEDYVKVRLEGMEDDINNTRPPAPDNVQVNESTDGILVTWNPVDEAVKYNVSLVESDGSLTSLGIVNAPAITYLYSPDDLNTTLRFVVKSINSQGLESHPSSQAVYTPDDPRHETPFGIEVIFIALAVAILVYNGYTRRKRR